MTKVSLFTTETTIADADKIPFIKDPDGTPIQSLITKANFGGGAGNTFARKVKPVDEIVNNSITLQDDDHLFFTPTINKSYGFYLWLLIVSDANADFKFAFTLPTGATGFRSNAFWNAAAAGSSKDVTTTSSFITTSSINQFYVTSGRFIMGSTAGDINFQWCQQILDVSDTKVLDGSHLIVWEEV